MLTEKDFIAPLPDLGLERRSFTLTAEAPSNIALVKYWGKYDHQIPMNPSVSLTLNKSKTLTKVRFQSLSKPTSALRFHFRFEGEKKTGFEPKIAGFFQRIQKYVPFIRHFEWEIDSRNTFPHSSGIASSASAFAALSKLIVSLEQKLFPETDNAFLKRKASFLARLGSGSAARSIEHPVMIWGRHPELAHTSDLYAVKPEWELHPDFQNIRDSIVLVEKGQKQVSSSAGHELMNRHPYKTVRKQQAFRRVADMSRILQKGDWEAFIELTEAEALSLHALMMTSQPNYILMQPETLQIIQQIRRLRKQENIPVCFTLDAGANVHVLYPENYRGGLQSLLFDSLEKEIIHDFI